MVVGSVREVGAAIRARRKAVGLTVAKAAALAGVSRRLLLELEGGKRPNVGLAAVLRIAELLGLSVEVMPRGLPGTRASGERGRRV